MMGLSFSATTPPANPLQAATSRRLDQGTPIHFGATSGATPGAVHTTTQAAPYPTSPPPPNTSIWYELGQFFTSIWNTLGNLVNQVLVFLRLKSKIEPTPVPQPMAKPQEPQSQGEPTLRPPSDLGVGTTLTTDPPPPVSTPMATGSPLDWGSLTTTDSSGGNGITGTASTSDFSNVATAAKLLARPDSAQTLMAKPALSAEDITLLESRLDTPTPGIKAATAQLVNNPDFLTAATQWLTQYAAQTPVAVKKTGPNTKIPQQYVHPDYLRPLTEADLKTLKTKLPQAAAKTIAVALNGAFGQHHRVPSGQTEAVLEEKYYPAVMRFFASQHQGAPASTATAADAAEILSALPKEDLAKLLNALYTPESKGVVLGHFPVAWNPAFDSDLPSGTFQAQVRQDDLASDGVRYRLYLNGEELAHLDAPKTVRSNTRLTPVFHHFVAHSMEETEHRMDTLIGDLLQGIARKKIQPSS